MFSKEVRARREGLEKREGAAGALRSWQGVVDQGACGVSKGRRVRSGVGCIPRIHEADNMPAAQSLYSLQDFCGESLRVIGDKVRLDFAWASPHERAEGASTTGHVYVIHMSF